MITVVGEEIRRFLVAVYAYEDLVQARCSVVVQSLLDTLMFIFERVGLRINITHMKMMVFISGMICTCKTREIYNSRMVGHANLR